MFEKKRSETLLKIMPYVEIFENLPQSYFQNAHPELCPKQQL